MIFLEKIQLSNIRTFREAEVNFTEGINVITGKNGAGKTTLIQAIYGSLVEFKNIFSGAKIEDLIRLGSRKGQITLHFRIGDTKYKVVTTINPRGVKAKELYQYSGSENNWKKLTSTKRETIEKMEQLTGIKISTLKKVIYCPQGELTDIISSKKEERKKIFKYLLDLEKYEKSQEIAKKIKNALENENDKKQSNIEILNNDAKKEKETREKLKEEIKRKESIEKALKELNPLLKEKQKVYDELKTKKQKADQLRGQEKQLTTSLNKKDKNLSNLLKEIKTQNREKEFPSEQKKLETLLEELETKEKQILSKKSLKEKELREIEDKKEKLERFYTQEKSIEKDINKLQEKIKAVLKDEYIEDTNILYENINERKGKITEYLDDINEKLTEKKGKLENYKTQIKEKKKSLNQFEKEKQKLKNLVNSITEEHGIEDLTVESIVSMILEKEKQLVKSNKEKAQASEEIGVINSTIAENKRKIGELKKSIELLKTSSEPTCPVCGNPLDEQHKAEILEKYTNDLEILQKEQKHLQKKEKQLKTRKNKIDKQLELLSQEIENLRVKKEKLQEIEKYNTDINELEKKLESLNEEISSLEPLVKKVTAEILNLEKEKEKLVFLYNAFEESLKYIQTIREKTVELGSIKQNIRELKEAVSEKKISTLNKEIEELSNRMMEVSEKLTRVKKLINLFEKKDALEKEISETKESLEKIIKELASLEFNEKEFLEIENELNDLRNKEAQLYSELKSLTETIIPRLENDLSEIESKKEMISTFKKEIDENEKVLEYLDIVIDVLKGLPSSITKNRLRNAEFRANQIVKRFFEDREIDGIRIGHDNYSIRALRGGKEEDIRRFSGGEQAVMAFALRVSLLQELGKISLMLLDEPTSALDTERLEEFIHFLEMENPVKQLVLVTHREEFEKATTNAIMIERKRTESVISSSF